MQQTILAVTVPLVPEGAAMAVAAVRAFDAARERVAAIATLHFMSMAVFEDAHFDPTLVVEINVDGAPRHFWPELATRCGPELLAILRFAKADRHPAPATPAQLPAFLERHQTPPAAYHRGNRGLTAGRILAEARLFQAAQHHLDEVEPTLVRLDPVSIHRQLRLALAPLPPAEPARSSPAETLRDFAPVILAAGVLAAVLLLWWRLGGSGSGLLLAIFLIAAALAALLLGVRRLERRDPTHDLPRLDPERLRRLRAAETGPEAVQNHLASKVLVKPGVLRGIVIRVALWALGVLARVKFRDGYLGQMRTIHFAHWAFTGNGSRLLFLSNFDGSWESYLDDFVEKAHLGLTLAWSNCIGFPRTRWLVLEGATHGREFKAWARASQAETLFWHRAYPRLTVNQIERSAAFADGLRREVLPPDAARAWAKLL